jgi:hypothetical protein
VRLTIALLVWAAAVVGAVAVSSTVAGSIHTTPTTSSLTGLGSSGGGSSFSRGGGSAGGSSSVDPSSIKASDHASLFRTANFSKVLGKARAALGANAQIDNFALYPGYVSITAVNDGGEVNFYADANGRVEKTSDSGSPGATKLIRLSQVGVGVPAALAHRVSSAGHVPVSQLHYIVVMVDPVSGHGLWWLVYPVQGNKVEYFKASGATGPLFEYRANSSTGLQPVTG